MAKPLIDYHKEVLSKISFTDRAIFRKEMRKAFRCLVPEEREDLKQWYRSFCVCRVAEQGTDGKAGLRT